MAGILWRTERPICREIDHEDLPAMVEVYGDKKSMRWVGDGEPLDEEGCRKRVEITQTLVCQ